MTYYNFQKNPTVVFSKSQKLTVSIALSIKETVEMVRGGLHQSIIIAPSLDIWRFKRGVIHRRYDIFF